MSERWIPFDVRDADVNPFRQFVKWFDEAQPEMREREAIALTTVSAQGRPSTRMVLLRHYDDTSFGWFTNYESRKGRELAATGVAALLWYCEPLGRQIRIEGHVTRMSPEASDAYFLSRPRSHQLGAWASKQSEPLESRAAFDARYEALEAEFAGRDIPRPDYWGGFRLVPDLFEFWQHRTARLHDRVIYTPVEGGWHLERQNP